MVKLASTFSRLKPFKVLVIGDLLLDTYTVGKVRRISPEAPVAVLHVQSEEHRPGGSGNVALNLVSLGAEVVIVGRMGNDWAGQQLSQVLQQENLDVNPLITQEHYCTPVKNRVIADNQQIVRIDHEQITSLPEHLEQLIIDSLPALLQGVKIVAISDYGKGFLTPTLINAVITQAKKQKISVITDPKGHDFLKYKGSTVIKPNLGEAYVAAGLPQTAPIESVAKKLLDITQAQYLMVTRSEAGISLFDAAGERQDFPVHVKQVKDVTGAGDTVLAVLTFALANDLLYSEAAQLCNIAAGIAIEQVGCARVTLADLAHRFLEIDVRNKVFDEEHLFALQEVLKRRPFILLGISHLNELTHHLFRAIKRLASEQTDLLLYIDEQEPDEDLIEILASLKEIHFILIHRESLKALCENIQPVAAYLFKANELKSIAKFSEISYGGQQQAVHAVVDTPDI